MFKTTLSALSIMPTRCLMFDLSVQGRMRARAVTTVKRGKQSNLKQEINELEAHFLKSCKVIIQSIKLLKNIKNESIPGALLNFAKGDIVLRRCVDDFLCFCHLQQYITAQQQHLGHNHPRSTMMAALWEDGRRGEWGEENVKIRIYLHSYINCKPMRVQNQRGAILHAQKVS